MKKVLVILSILMGVGLTLFAAPQPECDKTCLIKGNEVRSSGDILMYPEDFMSEFHTMRIYDVRMYFELHGGLYLVKQEGVDWNDNCSYRDLTPIWPDYDYYVYYYRDWRPKLRYYVNHDGNYDSYIAVGTSYDESHEDGWWIDNIYALHSGYDTGTFTIDLSNVPYTTFYIKYNFCFMYCYKAIFKFMRDSTNPTVTVSQSPATNSPSGDWYNGWYKGSSLTYTASFSDSQSGLQYKQYNIDNGSWSTYYSARTIYNQGITTIKFRGIDNVNNTRESTYTAKMDRSPPWFSSSIGLTPVYPNVNSRLDSSPTFSLSWIEAIDYPQPYNCGLRRYYIEYKNVTDGETNWTRKNLSSANRINDFQYVTEGDKFVSPNSGVAFIRGKKYEVRIQADDNLDHMSGYISGIVHIPMNPLEVSGVTYDHIPYKVSPTIEYDYHLQLHKVIKQGNVTPEQRIYYEWSEYLSKIKYFDINIYQGSSKIQDDPSPFIPGSVLAAAGDSSNETWEFQGNYLVYNSQFTGIENKHKTYEYNAVITQNDNSLTEQNSKLNSTPTIIPNYPADYHFTISKGVKVFVSCDPNYNTIGVLLTAGQYSLSQLIIRGINDNSISALWIPEGLKVTVFDGDNFTGNSSVFYSNKNCLEDQHFNNCISSLRIEDISPAPNSAQFTPYVTCYQHCDFNQAGYSVKLTPGEYTFDLLSKLGMRDNDISSIKIPPGFRVTVYENDNFTGNSAQFFTDKTCLEKQDINDKITSIKVENISSYPNIRSSIPYITCYEQCGYSEAGYMVNLVPGRYDTSLLESYGIKNNDLSSIKIPPGYIVAVYDDNNFQNQLDVFDGDKLNGGISCLVDIDCDNIISSLIVVKNETTGQRYFRMNTNLVEVAIASRIKDINNNVFDVENDQLKYYLAFANITDGDTEKRLDVQTSHIPYRLDISDINLAEQTIGRSSGKYMFDLEVGEYDDDYYLPYAYTDGNREYLNYGWNNNVDPPAWMTDQATDKFQFHVDLKRPLCSFSVVSKDEDRIASSGSPANSTDFRLFINRYSRQPEGKDLFYSGAVHDDTGTMDSGISDIYFWDITEDTADELQIYMDKINNIHKGMILGFIPEKINSLIDTATRDKYFTLIHTENGDKYVLKDEINDNGQVRDITDEDIEILKTQMMVSFYEEVQLLLSREFYENIFPRAKHIPVNLTNGQSFPQDTISDIMKEEFGFTDLKFFPTYLRKDTFNNKIIEVLKGISEDDAALLESCYSAGLDPGEDAEFIEFCTSRGLNIDDYVKLNNIGKNNTKRISKLLKGIGYFTWRIGCQDHEDSRGTYIDWSVQANSEKIDDFKFIGMRVTDGCDNSYSACQVVRIDTVKPNSPDITSVDHSYLTKKDDNGEDVNYIKFEWDNPLFNELYDGTNGDREECREYDDLIYRVYERKGENYVLLQEPVATTESGAYIDVPVGEYGNNDPVEIRIESIDPAGNVSAKNIRYIAFTLPELKDLPEGSPVQGYSDSNGLYVEWAIEDLSSTGYDTIDLKFKDSNSLIIPAPGPDELLDTATSFTPLAGDTVNKVVFRHSNLTAHYHYYYSVIVYNSPPRGYGYDIYGNPMEVRGDPTAVPGELVSHYQLENDAPEQPVITEPEKYISEFSTLRWDYQSTDVDGDSVACDIYIDDGPDPISVNNKDGELAMTGLDLNSGNTYTVTVVARDNYMADRKSASAVIELSGDSDDPEIKVKTIIDSDAVYTNIPALVIDVTDATSGIAEYRYIRGSQQEVVKPNPEYEEDIKDAEIPLDDLVDGEYTIIINAHDHTLREAAQNQVSLHLDHEKPQLDNIVVGTGGAATYYCTDKVLPVTFDISDTYSGVKGFRYRFVPNESSYDENDVLEGRVISLTDSASLTSPVSVLNYISTLEQNLFDWVNVDYYRDYLLEITPIDWAGNEGKETIVTTPIEFDSTPPVIAGPEIVSLFNHNFIGKIDDITVKFSFNDPHTGAIGFYAVVKKGDEVPPDAWKEIVYSNAGNNEFVPEWDIVEGEEYVVACKAVNSAGLVSEKTSLTYFVLDTSAPDIAGVDVDSYDILIYGDQVKINVKTRTVFSTESGIKEYRLAIESEDPNIPEKRIFSKSITGHDGSGWIPFYDETYEFRVPEVPNGDYRILIEVEDRVGNISSNFNSILTVDNSLKRISVLDAGDYTSDNSRLYGEWFYNGEDTGLIGFEFRLIDDAGNNIIPWPADRDSTINDFYDFESNYSESENWGSVTIKVRDEENNPVDDPKYFVDGTKYFFEARPVFEDGSDSQSRMSNGIIVDKSKPKITVFSSPFACKNDKLAINFEASDPHSYIGKIKVSYDIFEKIEVQSEDEEDKKFVSIIDGILEFDGIWKTEETMDINLNDVQLIFRNDGNEPIELQTGWLVKLTLNVENRATGVLDSNTSVTIIDNTPPEPYVLDQGDYIFAGNEFKDPQLPVFDWRGSREDPESGTVKYEWSLCYDKNGSDIDAWYTPDERDKKMTVDISLHPELGFVPHGGDTVYFAVKATNGAGIEGIDISNGITYDGSVPYIYYIGLLDGNDEDVNYVTTNRNLRLKVDVDIAYAPITNYQVWYGELDENKEIDLINTIPYSSSTSTLLLEDNPDTTEEELPPSFTEGVGYRFKGECWNREFEDNPYMVGIGYSTDIILDTKRPVVDFVDGYEKDGKLNFDWMGIPNYAPITGYTIILYYAEEIGKTYRKIYEADVDNEKIKETFENHDDGLYYLTVVAHTSINQSLEKRSQSVVLDTTPPEISSVQLPEFASINIHIYATAEDSLSEIIEYQYAIGTLEEPFAITRDWIIGLEENPEDSTENIKITGTVFDKTISFDEYPLGFDSVLDGEKVYILIRAKSGLIDEDELGNEAGNWSDPIGFGPVVIDKSPPAVPAVNCGKYTIFDNKIPGADFSSSDNESGIARYRTIIVRDKEAITQSGVEWNVPVDFAGFITELNITDKDIAGDTSVESNDGVVYFVAVQVQNGAGDWSGVGFSDSVLSDLSSPNVAFVEAGNEIIINEPPNEEMCKIKYTVSESVSEPVKLEFTLIPPAPDLPENYTDEKKNGEHIIDFGKFNKLAYGTYSLEVVAHDSAGRRFPEDASIKPPTQIIRVNQPPDVEFQEMVANPGRPIQLYASSVKDYDGDDYIFYYEWRCGRGIPKEIKESRFEKDVLDKCPDNNARELITASYTLKSGAYILKEYFLEQESIGLADIFEDYIHFVSYDEKPYYVFFHNTVTDPVSYQGITLKVFDAAFKWKVFDATVFVINTQEGSLYVNEYWSLTPGYDAHRITGNIYVHEILTLTILQNSRIATVGNSVIGYKHRIRVDGTLIAEAGSHISKSGEHENMWDGIYIKGKAVLNGTTISYADYGVVVAKGAMVEIKASTLEFNKIGALVFENDDKPLFENCIFKHNFTYGIKEDSGGRPVVINCQFMDNRFDYYHKDITVMGAEEINTIEGNSGNSPVGE